MRTCSIFQALQNTENGQKAPQLENSLDSIGNFQVDDEDEEEDDDDVEPKLTYDRIGNDVASIMKTDTASCLTLYERV